MATAATTSTNTNKGQGRAGKATSHPPTWAAEISEKYGAAIAHAFILFGNTQDYVSGSLQLLKDYLLASFARRDVVVYYNRSNGFYFPSQKMKDRFKEIVSAGLGGQAQSTSRSGGGLAGAIGSAAQTQAQVLDDAALEQIGRQPVAALNLLTKLLRYEPEPNSKEAKNGFTTAVILDYADTLAPAGDNSTAGDGDRTNFVTLSEWGRDPHIANRDNMLFMIVNDPALLNEQLRKSGARWEQIEIPFPSYDERLDFIRFLVENQDDEQAEYYRVALSEGTSYEALARLTTGLRLVDIHDIFLRATFLKQPLSQELAKARKDEIFKNEFDDVLAQVDSPTGFEALGGLVEVKEALREYVIKPMTSGQHHLVPQGILLMGPAGTGKSRIAKALAREAGFTFVELQPSKIFSKFVGDTERRLERALTAIKAMAPCIVFIDEIDQAINRGEGGGGDNGVSSRVFKRLMEIMSDTMWRGKILWIGATNRPDLLDAALLRPGRFDEKIPVLAPDTKDRAAILEVLTRQILFSTGKRNSKADQTPEAEFLEGLAARMENYTGAEIELVVHKALKLREKLSGAVSIADALAQAYERIIPTTQDVEAMTELALLHCSDLDLVPQSHRERARLLRLGEGKTRTSSSSNDEAAEATQEIKVRKARRAGSAF